MAHFVNFQWRSDALQQTQKMEKISYFTSTTQYTYCQNNYTPFQNVINQPQFIKKQNTQICVVNQAPKIPSQKSLVQNLLFESNYQQPCKINYNEQESELDQSIVEQLYDPVLNNSNNELESLSDASYDFGESSDIQVTQIQKNQQQNQQAFEQMQKVFFEELNKMEKSERDNIVETLLQLEESQMHEFIVFLMDKKNTKKNSDKIRQSMVYVKKLQSQKQKRQFEMQNFQNLRIQSKKSKNLKVQDIQIYQACKNTQDVQVPQLSNFLLQNFSQLFSSNLSNNAYQKSQTYQLSLFRQYFI